MDNKKEFMDLVVKEIKKRRTCSIVFKLDNVELKEILREIASSMDCVLSVDGSREIYSILNIDLVDYKYFYPGSYCDGDVGYDGVFITNNKSYYESLKSDYPHSIVTYTGYENLTTNTKEVVSLPVNKSDDHYRDIESNGVEPIVIMEQLISRLIKDGIPANSAINIVLAQKHITRAGAKKDNSWEKEINKAINYLTRAVSGEWVK